MKKSSKIFVAGHNGLVGSAILRLLADKGYSNIITRHRSQLDLRNQESVASFFAKSNPSMFSWPLRRWAALWPTTITRLNLFTTT